MPDADAIFGHSAAGGDTRGGIAAFEPGGGYVMAGTGNQRTTAATIMKPSSWLWIMVHVAFPLIPFFLEALLRFALTRSVSFATFSVPNLAMSMGLLAFFVNQSLANYSIPLKSGGRKDAIEFRKSCFIVSAIFCFAFFGALIMVNGSDSAGAAGTLSMFVLILALIIVILAYRTQREFKLKAVI